MSYKLKTLIVFDTNALRNIEEGEVAYRYFTLGTPFKDIEEFILKNGLNEDIQIAIPTWAIEELKDQKNRQYKEDIVKFQKLAKRLSGMPHIPEIALPEVDFDCTAYIKEKTDEYLATKEIILLEITEELAYPALSSMMKRVMKDQNKKKPFANSGKYKDAGFKDNIVWESIMNYESVASFDKVILITNDADFYGCEAEFKDKYNRHISIISTQNDVISAIQKDYDFYINERAIYDFASTDYFKKYLLDNFKMKSKILIDDQNYKIENSQLIDTCFNVERMPQNQVYEEYVIIHSSIKVFFSKNSVKKELVVLAKTTLADGVTKEILETIYEPELV